MRVSLAHSRTPARGVAAAHASRPEALQATAFALAARLCLRTASRCSLCLSRRPAPSVLRTRRRGGVLSVSLRESELASRARFALLSRATPLRPRRRGPTSSCRCASLALPLGRWSPVSVRNRVSHLDQALAASLLGRCAALTARLPPAAYQPRAHSLSPRSKLDSVNALHSVTHRLSHSVLRFAHSLSSVV